MRNTLAKVCDTIDALNKSVGSAVSWLVLVMVGLQFAVVLFRYLFDLNWIWLQEIPLYAHAIIFLTAASWTLLEEGHVRVDVFYLKASPRKKAWVNLLGTLLLLLPTVIVLFCVSFPYVTASWEILERSKDGGGLDAVFILKSFLLVFALLTGLQGVSLLLRSFLSLREP